MNGNSYNGKMWGTVSFDVSRLKNERQLPVNFIFIAKLSAGEGIYKTTGTCSWNK